MVVIGEDEVRGLLKRHIEEIGTQREFAARMGVSEQFICAVLKGRKRPTAEMLECIGARRGNCYFMDGKDSA